MGVALRARVDDKQFPGLYHLVVQVIMQGLAVLGQDGREGNAPALGKGDALHQPDDVLLDDAGADGVPGDRMHLVSERT